MSNTIVINNIEEFTQEVVNGGLVLTRIVPFLDEAMLFQRDLRGSTIIGCKFNGAQINITKYMKLLVFIYSTIDKETILQNSILNVIQEEISVKGFKFYNQWGLSIQRVESRKTLKEIINIVKVKSYRLELKIKLKTGEMVGFNI